MSVVMNALARFSHAPEDEDNVEVSFGIAEVIESMGRCCPITPVDRTSVPAEDEDVGRKAETFSDIAHASFIP